MPTEATAARILHVAGRLDQMKATTPSRAYPYPTAGLAAARRQMGESAWR